MDVEIRIDPSAHTPKVIILTDRITDDVTQLVQTITSGAAGIAGTRNGTIQLLDPSEILRVYTNGRQVAAATASGEFSLRLRLYEAEERLSGRGFARISNSEIVNLRHVRYFDVSRSGVFRVVLDDDTSTFVSRRYIPQIRKLLGL